MRVAQINFLPVPAEVSHARIVEEWHSLADIAEAVASADVRVTVIQASTRTERIVRNGIDYRFIDIGTDTAPASRALRYSACLDELDVDVVHAHSLGFADEAFAIGQRRPGLPQILQDHADRVPPWWRRLQARRWYTAAAGVAFTAAAQAQPWLDAGLFGALLPVFAIPESSNRFSPGSRMQARERTGLYGDPCVLWVGHLTSGKDPMTALEGVARAVERLPGLRLYCAFGRAPLRDAVQRRIDGDARLQGRVQLLGKVPHADIETLLQAADLFLAASLGESCGYAAMEALACGVPTVLSDIPSFRALTDGGRVGQLFPCGDAARLADALVSVATIRPSVSQVRAHFDAHLSFAAVGRLWADAYAHVLEHRRRRVG
ncbi:MAG TPA: glycosyltransferase family 4 protein [Dyella sp.]|uniref:glycosyltransferase family 4 protein n=1 Tax=Dyella sp. TaxID=1869338 RepID=UPI002F9505F2